MLSATKIIGFENSAAAHDAWIRACSIPFPNHESWVGGIEFPLDVHYGRMTEYMMAGLGTGNLGAVKAKQKVLPCHQCQSVCGIMFNSGMLFITPKKMGELRAVRHQLTVNGVADLSVEQLRA